MQDDIVYRVKENPDYIRDEKTGAILNTNTTKLNEYRAKKQQKEKIDRLEQELKELKDLLRVVLERQQCQ